MSGKKAKTIRKQKKLGEFNAPAKSSQFHLRDRRDGSIFNFNTEFFSLQWMKEKWDAGRLHFDCSVQRPADLMKHFTKNGITRTVIHGGSIHPIIIHHYTVNGEDHWDILNGGHRISFILFELIYDWKNENPKEKFYYTGPDGDDYEYEHMSFDEMESSTRKKIEDFKGIVADIFHNLSDEGIGELMIQSNTTEPLNEAARCNAKMSPYRDAIRRIVMDRPMCPSPIDGELNQHETFAKIIKNNSKKHLGHFDLMSWLTLPRFFHLYDGLSIYEKGTTNSVTIRESIFGNTLDQGKFKEKHLAQPDKFNELVKIMQKDAERYGILWSACKNYNKKPKKSKVKGVDKTLFSKTEGSLHDATKMGPWYFLLGLEQQQAIESNDDRKIFKLKDPELFLIEYTKAHTKLLEKVKTQAGGEVASDYFGVQGHWSPGEWLVKNRLLFSEMMKDKKNILQIGIVFVDSRECFTSKQRQEMYKEQEGICPITKKWYDIADMDADHIIPRAKGGPTEVWNGRMICRKKHQGFALAYTDEEKKDTSDDKSKSRKVA